MMVKIRDESLRNFFIVWISVFLGGFGTSPSLAKTWAEKLGYPASKRVLIFHADDIGLSWEANVAAENYFAAAQIQSGSVMMTCPWSADFVNWFKDHPEHDVGIHLTLNSEWPTYRWGPVARERKVRSLLDRWRFLLPKIQGPFLRAKTRHVRRELRAQIQRALDLGMRPTHLDSHMGTLFTRPDFFRTYLKVSKETGLPAMTMADVPATVDCFLRDDFPLKDLIFDKVGHFIGKELEDYPFPSLDVMCSLPKGKTYDEVRRNLFDLVRSLKPGITQIFLHPSADSAGLRRITNSWQQRVFEGQLFADPEVQGFLADEGILFTSW